MSTPVDAERAWRDLQRIRVPQERVYDEVERSASGVPGAAYVSAAMMWVFLTSLGLGLPRWGVWLVVVAFLALLGALGVADGRRSRVRLHHSRHTWRTVVAFGTVGAVTGGAALLSGGLLAPWEPGGGSLLQATVTTAAFLLVMGPANRWVAGSLRGHGARAARVGAGR